ncbi:two-component sensor histidine kinase [Enterococcus villorum]|uniref:Sensor histidine kinase n=2 Tax=Enterococcus villorum TaxID=112904 RepID=A0A1V8YF20_9ENTE|nr:two-component system sensor histidine kinase LiaS [Enterococcus villorum]EOH89233.1 two-component system sensor histidine kinase [Enterococcus villorum ATCC 700913]EOW76041.1 two-component system sensor histidine kinase [Enterococcus villorum ATCC 700913]OQO70916.1 two-component sensor histidine kinase [Enterococcus villorum]OQO74897.1 two-component sensor histidine kinase [Enterococcus villorum]GEL91095.1 sensor histidine kinase [Enterococcus villorum]
MISKLSKAMMAVYASAASFLIILFSLFTYFYANNQRHWWRALLSARLLYVPLIFHLFAIALGVGLMVFFVISIIQKAKYGKIEEKLRALSAGNYESNRLSEPIPRAVDDIYVQDIDQEITKIKEKMVEVSSELQIVTSRPQYVNGQTKEEILELERHRLARELHDSVSQQLFAAMMMMSALTEQAEKTDSSEMFRKQLRMVTDIINASQSEMRALLLHLRPVNLEGKRLKQGIEQLLKELQNKIQISLKWEIEDVKLSNSIEDHLFRIVQELLSNTLRHAKANELEVYLHKINNNLLLRVIDDGTGFNMNENKTGSYGLNNIKERVSGIGGTVKIISFKGQGTSIEIKVPLIKEA